MPWHQGLDEDFRSIAGYDGKYCCVIAAAGTGKSFALKRKVARLLEQGESPGRILAITFTRTAAKDIQNDLQSLGIEGCDLVRACTLHSLCYSILSKHEVFVVMQRETRTLLGYEADYLIADLSARLGRIKPLKEQLHAFTSAWARLLNEEPGWPHNEEDRAFDRELSAWLRFHRAMLIGELIPLTIKYLRSNPASPEKSQYSHIIVDEYQDLNKAEQELVKLLSKYDTPQNRTLTVAGDDDQSIFVTLKYAHPEGIINFKNEYPETFEKTLHTCKRCPRKVIELANAFLISTGRKHNPKLLNPAEDAIDGQVVILQWRTPNQEADGIASIIANKIRREEVKPEDILILTPRKPIGYEIANNLNSRGIKAVTCFAEALLAKNRAQEAYAYLTLLHDNNDAVSLRVLLGIDASDKRKDSYERIRKHCFESGDTIISTLARLHSGDLHIPRTGALVERYQVIEQKLGELSSLASVVDVINRLFPDGVEEIAGLRKLALEAQEGAQNINELYEAMNLSIIQPELPEKSDSVFVLTLHKAKGLTAQLVFIVNCLEGCIPYVGDYESEQQRETELAEQERLFFVALTRTKNTLIISSTGVMRRGDVARMNVKASTRKYWPETQASHFIEMLGPSAPPAQVGDDYLRTM